jgi:DNA-binding transcriptional LysR family regulator
MLPERIGESGAGLVRHSAHDALAKREVYLMLHPDRIDAPSVRAVADWIVQSFSAH